MSRSEKRYDILVIEDNPGDFVLLEDHLREIPAIRKIKNVIDFKSAVEVLCQQDRLFDLIFLDLSLPDKAGEALLREIKNFSNKIPIIILTGYSDLDFAVKTLSLGASDYLLKDVLNATILQKSIRYNIERNKILVTLKDSEKRYSDLFHFSPLPLWVFDPNNFKFLDVNNASLLHYGYSYEEFLTMDITQIMDKNNVNDFTNSITSLKKEHKSLFLGSHNHIKKNGDVIQVELRASSYVYNGKAAKIISVIDVTEKILQINAIGKQNKILQDIAWTQSHVVRAPLARLMGLIQAMQRNDEGMDDEEVLYQHLLASAEELDNIIKEVVNKSQEVNINQHRRDI